MARISEITLKEYPEYHSLTIRKTINFMEEYTTFADESFRKILDYVSSLDALVSDGPIVCFHNMDMEQLDVEAGFPVAKQIMGRDEITSNTIPVQKGVTAIDLGDYVNQDPTLEELFSWIQNHGLRPVGDIYYQYLNETNRPASQYLTKMFIPIYESDSVVC